MNKKLLFFFFSRMAPFLLLIWNEKMWRWRRAECKFGLDWLTYSARLWWRIIKSFSAWDHLTSTHVPACCLLFSFKEKMLWAGTWEHQGKHSMCCNSKYFVYRITLWYSCKHSLDPDFFLSVTQTVGFKKTDRSPVQVVVASNWHIFTSERFKTWSRSSWKTVNSSLSTQQILYTVTWIFSAQADIYWHLHTWSSF